MTTPDGKVNVVAIDGPVGVGKSTVARAVARELGFAHLDTGAMYRAVAWKYLQLPEEQQRPEALGEIARALNLEMNADAIYLDGIDISAAIRTEEVSRNVYLAADNRDVRQALVTQQRRIGAGQPSAMEGRDITTVVFPSARWKIYLDASPEARANRRLGQLERVGQKATRDEVMRNLIDRDARDRAREWGALRIADDATIIDTSTFDEQTVVDLICQYVRADG